MQCHHCVSSLSPFLFPILSPCLLFLFAPSSFQAQRRRRLVGPYPLCLGSGPHLISSMFFFSYPCISVLTCPSSPSTASTTRLQALLLRRRHPVGYSPAVFGSPALPMQGPTLSVAPQEEFIDLSCVIAVSSATTPYARVRAHISYPVCIYFFLIHVSLS